VCGVVQQRQEDLLSLWQTALSAEAAQSLDMKRYLTASLVSLLYKSCQHSANEPFNLHEMLTVNVWGMKAQPGSDLNSVCTCSLGKAHLEETNEQMKV